MEHGVGEEAMIDSPEGTGALWGMGGEAELQVAAGEAQHGFDHGPALGRFDH